MDPTNDPRVRRFAQLLAVVDRLRAPDGCPWDLEQTLPSMLPCLQEEAAEVADAVAAGGTAAVAEELGDVLMNVLLMARIAEDEGQFSLAEVAEGIRDKLVRRHPHVFGEIEVGDSDEVLRNWERIKREERGAKETQRESRMDGISGQWSALRRAQKQVSRAAKEDFVWPDEHSALRKVEEEFGELIDASNGEVSDREDELGDVLFALVAYAHRAGIDADLSLRRACDKFDRRFRELERVWQEESAASELEGKLRQWQRAKHRVQEREATDE